MQLRGQVGGTLGEWGTRDKGTLGNDKWSSLERG